MPLSALVPIAASSLTRQDAWRRGASPAITLSMDELKVSTEKLDKALARLETVLDGLLDKAGNPSIAAREVELLNLDRAKLAEELDEALARERQLQALADEASDALGTAIQEVRSALVDKEEAPEEDQNSVES